MNDSHIDTIAQIEKFLNSKEAANYEFEAVSKEEAYRWIEETLIKFQYILLDRKSKGIVREYLGVVTGYSKSQITRMISEYRKTGHVRLKEYKRNKFDRIYTIEDIELLAETDELHDFPNGVSLKRTLWRMYNLFKREEYKNIANISPAHIYNLRNSDLYRKMAVRYEKTKPRVINIGKRRKPKPNGKPGFIRVDVVHQGDLEGEKGFYTINAVDEVTQFEVVVAVEKISEWYMLPALGLLLETFPFEIKGFHTDNGSEFINYRVARLLNKLFIKFTKSRSRKCNDNALVESKNGSVVRKWMGYTHIKQEHAERINLFYFEFLNVYVNYHRPSAFPTEKIDKKGKVTKVYKPEDYKTPYEKLKSLENAKQHLKEGITFENLDEIAYAYDDNEFAEKLQKAREELFADVLEDAS